MRSGKDADRTPMYLYCETCKKWVLRESGKKELMNGEVVMVCPNHEMPTSKTVLKEKEYPDPNLPDRYIK